MASAENDTDAIERRSRGTRIVQRILHALLALTRAQQAAVEHAAESAARYSAWIEDVAAEVLGPARPARGQVLHVCFGPERAFCGPLARETLARLPATGDLGLIGTRLAEQAQGTPAQARVRFALPGCTTPYDARGVAHALADALLAHARGAEVHLHAPPHTLVLLARAAAAAPRADSYTPSAELVAAVLRERLESQLLSFALSALRTEVAARFVAVARARKAADERLADLEDALRDARQTAITRDLMEILAASELS